MITILYALYKFTVYLLIYYKQHAMVKWRR